MSDTGADAFTLVAMFGWSDIRMAMRYTHAMEDAKRRAVESNLSRSELEPHVKMQQLKFHVAGA